MARLGPLADKILIVEGTIERSIVNPEGGVRNATYIKVDDTEGLYHKWAHVGHHLVFVYGRHAKELGQLCKACGIQVL